MSTPSNIPSAIHLSATMHGYVMLEIAGLTPPGFDGDSAYESGVGLANEQILANSKSEPNR